MLGGLMMAAVMAVAPVGAAGAEAGGKYYVYEDLSLGGYSDTVDSLDVTVHRADTGKTLRYIEVCLQRQEDDHVSTRSCHKTDAWGHTNWKIYQGRLYRIHVTATQYHHPDYSEWFWG
ncbi:hypothetical protein [Actinocorallia longicatena]|uniref:Secreted protein n=1 Tax=Actinocorallia longicatena TaxID=111803 RepID=A0ABP6QNR9_9ACTN